VHPDVCHLIKNQASIFVSQKISAPPHRVRLSSTRQKPKNKKPIHGLLKDNVGSPRSSNRPSYRLESPKSDAPPPINESPLLNAEQFEYDTIEAPEKFPLDLYVDWRIFNLVLWSKCYCRYDENSMPTLSEQQLLSEISSLQERIQKKSPEKMTIDAFHSVRISNQSIYFLEFSFRLIMRIHGIHKCLKLVCE
jgi:hypothetical protein